MDIPLAGASTHTAQTIAFASLVVAAIALFPKLNLLFNLSKIPEFGTAKNGEKQRSFYLKYAIELYREGNKKFTDSIYRMAASDEIKFVIVPAKFLPELKKLPDDVLDVREAVSKALESKYLPHEAFDDILTHSAKADLTPALGRLNGDITEEIDLALDRAIPPCKDWTNVNIYNKLLEIVAQVSGRMFVGAEYCRDPTYLDLAVNFTNDFMGAVLAIKNCNPWLRRFKGPSLPAKQRFEERLRRSKEFLRPIVLERLSGEKKCNDLLQWMMERSKSHGCGNDVEGHISRQLTAAFAAVHTTSMVSTNILYSLAAAPEYLEPLREEIRTVKAAHGGKLDSRALQDLVKLDSVMKEVMRMFPANITGVGRYVRKPITLSNGQYIPAGVIIECPVDAIHFDQDTYSDADKFDGFRYYKLRQKGDTAEHARSQFVSSNERDLAFGYGKHACPGRFFAASEIKIILSRVLLEYDFKMPDGRTNRYDQIRHEKMLTPDTEKTLLMKRTV
ncbi:hypothetical protein COCMIDRAFT_22399 [Bipolaris oryzae ATCC 44560]|uniref:Cytochrome P450 monooxygenase n=1 Tax=Bipolaris oryzae ATCC 44560 TaxID=930090 RepID=W7A218_COCMI|nr:uncharacterized protein COCMIDRAFT_22399 [Bipolaris oryzae ATCC 44560]EUC50071.1 hypothetical protein COCMIDRAFT_22399 [Bipolaris oryzae ATCC 44560]